MDTLFDNISITGITPLDYYPDKCTITNCKQNIESISLCIPCQKPDMESINEIKVSFCINSCKLLNTILGPKILANITCKIKVIYTAKNPEQSLHSAHWDINFCDFILLETPYYDKRNLCTSNLFIGLEDVCVLDYDERYIELSLLYILCPNINMSNNTKGYVCKPEPNTNSKNLKNTYYYPIDYYENSSCCYQKPCKSD